MNTYPKNAPAAIVKDIYYFISKERHNMNKETKHVERNDVPMAGLYTVQRELERLDMRMAEQPNMATTHRTMILGILARLETAISEIQES